MATSGNAPARRAPIELEDIGVLRTELRGLREEYELLSRELRTSHKNLASEKQRRKSLRQKVADREEETSKLSHELGCAEEDVLALSRWRQVAKDEAKQMKELMATIESERAVSDARIAELKAVVKRRGRPNTAKALEAEATRSKREALDEHCARLQLLRDYIAGRLPLERESLAGLLADEFPSKAEEEEAEGEEDSPTTFDTDSVDTLIDDMKVAHDRAMKNLIETSNSIIEKKNHTWKRINKGLFQTSILRPERCALSEHPTIREVLEGAEALCLDRQARNVPMPRPKPAGEIQPAPDRVPDIPNKEASEGESTEGQAED